MLMIKSFYWYFFNRKRYNTYKILKWIIKAKKYFIKYNCDGMCIALLNTNNHLSFYRIKDYILEYYPKFFNTEEDDNGYWWKPDDKASRICAFNKLIRIYKLKLYK